MNEEEIYIQKNEIELCYIWIKNYKGIIVEQGFNFSGKNRYTYKNNILYKEENKNYINNFYGESIVGITGIVGKNGSGKSTILDFIKKYLNDNLSEMKDETIIIFSVEGKDVIYNHSNLMIKNLTDLNMLMYSDCKKINMTDLDVVYFSNVFDLKDYGNSKSGEHNNFVDMSTNYLLSMDKYMNSEEFESTEIGEVEAHIIAELHRQIKFTFEYKPDKPIIDFCTPNEIEVTLRKFEYLGILETCDYLDSDDPSNEIITVFFNKLNYVENEIQSEKKMYIYALVILLLEYIMYLFHEHAYEYFKIILDFIVKEIERVNQSEKDIEEEFKMFWENIKIFIDNLEIDNKNSSIKKSTLEKILIGSGKLYDFIYNRKETDFFEGKLILNNKSDIQDILKFFEETLVDIRILEFKWRNLSSGQSALLSMFSRLYDGPRRLKKNIILLIDEGELYFHPQWQKRLVKYLIDYLPDIYNSGGKKRNIQVILTSNSPFIISDLPKHNIIFLENNSEQCRVYAGLEDKKQTFAANIHTLLIDSFFMEHTIGDFARNKLSELVNILNCDSSEISEKKEEIKKTINIIGEPIIKNKLLSILEDKLKLGLLDVEDEMDILTNRIQELEQKIQMLEGEKNN